ncbi:DUF2336 domain-containing protein [Pseudokordiimonas caeni]|uniref:DUF2336 domain-containing protein n=1 Tax=Pseudokordiimonas caeni TaxID=2997908 RepID=UPI002811272B|nr:DUF2336 domain-containing protein [Pseudokordiimonas caeni]
MADNKTLSSADVAKLLQDPNTDNRADAAAKVAATFSSSALSEGERAIAEDIFRVMLKDAAVRVRAALSESLKENPDVPHDVAATLARDVDEVALPFIESSSVLTDEDLLAIVQSSGEGAQKAVASRATVSATVADALARTDNENVVATLVANEGAQISEATYGHVIDKFGANEKINAPLAQRGELPIGVAERLVTLVSEKLREHIMSHHEISASMASDLLLESREKATVSLLEGGQQAQNVLQLVDQLYKNKRLTSTLILRALFMGDTTFFEAALARIVGIPAANAYQLVHDKGDMGLKRLFEAAKMPIQFLPVARAALEVADEMVTTGGDDRERFKQLMIERVLTAVEDSWDTENLDYLIGKLHKIESPTGAVA